MRVRLAQTTKTRGSVGMGSGAFTGTVLGAVTMAVLAFGAPAFLAPAVPATVLLLATHAAAGALVGYGAWIVAGRRRPDAAPRVSAAAAALCYGAALGIVCLALARPQARGLAIAGAALATAAMLWGALRLVRASAAARLITVGLVVVTAVATTALRSQRSPARPGARVIVVGLDGGSWRVMDPLLTAGELPTVARLAREGASGVLRSHEPMSSSVLWTSIATGKMPEKHGVHDFYATQNEHLGAARFWEIVAATGEPVGIFRWLVTWPPDSLPGFIVPGWLARDDRTQPASLEPLKTLELSLQERRRPSLLEAIQVAAGLARAGLRLGTVTAVVRDAAAAWWIGDQRALYRAGRFAQLAINGDVFLHQYATLRPRLATITFYGSDALSHAYWKYHEPELYTDVSAADVALYGDSIREYYRRFDRFLARLLVLAGDDTTILVVSDHGFRGAEDRLLAVSAEGLVRAAGAGDALRGHAINRQAYLVPTRPGTPEAAAARGRAAAVLAAIRYQEKPLLTVERTETGLTVELVQTDLDLAATVEGDGRQIALADLVTRTTWSGSHELAGIVLARGPTVRTGLRIENASVLDVAPTVLHLLGHPVGADMDGRALTGLLRRSTEVTTVASHDGAIPDRSVEVVADDGVTDRLRALGYVR